MEKYIEQKCDRCKNKSTDLCHITKNIVGKWQCVYLEESDENEEKF